MINEITVTGLILYSAPCGDYDRRIVILTKERGKMTAFANGARKPNHPLAGTVHPFSFGTFTLREHRDSSTLVSASISNYFEGFRSDLEAAYYGYYFLEFASYYAREMNNETELLKLLYQSLRALLSDKLPNKLVRAIFELKIVTINGEGPNVQECTACGCREGDFLFSIRRGGLICSQCMGKITDGRKLLPATLYAMQFVAAMPPEKLFSFALKEENLIEFEDVMRLYLQEHVGRRFKTLDMLEAIAGP